MPPRLEIDARTVRLILISFVLLAGLSVHRLWLADVPLDTDVLIVQGRTMGTTFELRVAGDGLSESLRIKMRLSHSAVVFALEASLFEPVGLGVR